ncbi:hypothetical protein [Paenibacillus dendritiformis]|uniref:hypothetical protein n=1 Tax=Paenibacillus dendritiformis TaxID=130049 RepID=UPI0002E7D952|nr:hypothetical protein [Paenibacillus dendritiformis]CAH8771024.1 hypothetical protein H7S4_003759 [Paenibacillus dendritiformis]
MDDLRELLRALRLEPMTRWGYLLSPLGIPRLMKLYIGAQRLPRAFHPYLSA